MELHEFHVAQLGTGPVSRRHAVAGGDCRVGRLAVNHARAAAGQDRLLGPDEEQIAVLPVDQGADAPPFVGEQVDGERIVPDRDILVLPGALDDRPHDLVAGAVAQCVDDAVMAVPALAGQGQMPIYLVEIRAPAQSGR